MKLIAILTLATLLQVQARSFAQQITFSQKNVPLKQVFNEINKQTGYNILWASKSITNNQVVSVNFNKASITEALSQCLKGYPLTYTITNKTIVIREFEEPQVKTGNEVKYTRITGIVTDNAGLPLPGATVKVKGGNKTAICNEKGAYNIDAVSGDVLVFTFIGFVPAEITVGTQTEISISLKEIKNELGGVVITALGIKKQTRTLSYNVQEVNNTELTKVKDPNFVNALTGKIAGATINSSSAGPGASTRVVLRGTKSISGNNNALYVVDGIPLQDLSSAQPGDVFSGAGQTGDGISNINPEDIESISVLTGPSAAALYGNKGANGVVVITTKKGSANGFSATVSNSTTFSSPFVLPKFQNTYGSEEGTFASWGDKLKTPTNYNPKDFFQTGVNSTTAFTLSTGTDKNQTYFSAAVVNANGIIHNNDLTRYNFNVRNTSKFLNDKLTLDLSAMYTSTQEQNMLAQGQYFNPLVPIYLFPRGDDIRKYQAFERYNPERNFKTQYWPFGDQGFQMQNPYWITERDLFQNNKDRYMLTAGLQYNINSWMNVSARIKSDRSTALNERKYYASTSGLFASATGAYHRYNITSNQTYADVLLNINKTLGDFSVSANVGASLQDDKYSDASIAGNLAAVPNLFSYNNIDFTQIKPLQNGYHNQVQAIFATTQVGYKGLVYLDATIRRDEPSQLAGTSKTAIFYPSAGLSSVLTDVFKVKSDVLSFMKVRVSYGEVGNPPPSLISIATYPLLGVGGLPTTLATKAIDLRPERTKSYEAGLNVMLWNGKVKIDGTVYKSSTYNQLFNPAVSETTTFGSIFVNGGRIDNKGIEVSVALKQDLGAVKWNTTLVYSLNRNKVNQLLEPTAIGQLGVNVSQDTLDLGGTTSYKMLLTKGGSMGDIYVNTLKVDEHGLIYVNPTNYTVSADQSRYVKAGNANPDYTLGWRNSFSYKGIDVGFLVTARVGGVGVSVTQAIMDGFGVSQNSATARDNGGALVNGFKIPAQAYYSVTGGGSSGIGAMYVYSATNVRLGEASIGYDIPLNKYYKWIKGFNVSVIGRNLFMFYNKAPYDPESTANTGTYYQGIDYFMQPSLRSIGFSARLKF
ncbi:SusC/RagA family TonB-linked outer membrane protein [Mucilaginibacter phyllosphaerae]|uniref:SusC/RagA family TonB-linked outer membrane protein n=1 Tax=Mucilaginibacter phyllosphaerae TaxID=1812349 RepID=A0A4Y8ABN0_9SPHI|nr:SusC/RagA family TonB-linked outer membrane protein [Mucilaginibacter phyllosphaerae]MBB3969216.1 TonB-linked SusC/RagA family outer membrane protein [Mucilaginibacter phyllosphaerae]TEW65981.1 SusC/RagA family TonB-linked outer membrane protein [Mucilaginibacter phyllosphaerae]GGH07039.1 SusC/RagA family TonB-linked outer membrane protein [Mucilaginibacter phyllosphaerae]